MVQKKPGLLGSYPCWFTNALKNIQGNRLCSSLTRNEIWAAAAGLSPRQVVSWWQWGSQLCKLGCMSAVAGSILHCPLLCWDCRAGDWGVVPGPLHLQEDVEGSWCIGCGKALNALRHFLRNSPLPQPKTSGELGFCSWAGLGKWRFKLQLCLL